MSNDLPRGPVSNEIDLAQTVAGFVYSVIFWLPKQIGLPVPPTLIAKQIKLEERTYTFQ